MAHLAAETVAERLRDRATRSATLTTLESHAAPIPTAVSLAAAPTNFRFSYTKLWSVYVKLWSVYVTWFCFALELALEGPPGPLADGHLLPHA